MNLYSETDIFVVEIKDPDDDDVVIEYDVEMTLGEAVRLQWNTKALRRHRAWLS